MVRVTFAEWMMPSSNPVHVSEKVPMFLPGASVTAALAFLFSMTDPGVRVHVDLGGPPEHVRPTFPARPPIAARLMVYVAECPAGMVGEAGVAMMVKSCTVSVAALVVAELTRFVNTARN